MNDNKNKPRVPQTLQTVFLASNRGKEILKPPPEKVAYKIFLQSWWQSHEDKGEAGSRMNRDKHGSKVWNNLMKKKNQSSANKSIHETYFQSPSLGVVSPRDPVMGWVRFSLPDLSQNCIFIRAIPVAPVWNHRNISKPC